MLTFTHNGIRYNIDTNVKGKHEVAMFKYYLDNKKMPTREEMKSDSFQEKYDVSYSDNPLDQLQTKNRKFDVEKIISVYNSEKNKQRLKEDNQHLETDELGFPTPEARPEVGEAPFNPYTQWLEQQRMTTEGQELGLLNEQTRAGQQNAEISAQQSMIQQAQLRDQIVEQIKLDRMSKMRQGITPMQIANESLQFTVGNIQANNQEMTGVNQARLAATQQQGLNPYQAYLNSVNGVGYQTQGNVASGMAATDASDMYQQALKYAKSQGRSYIKPEDYDRVQGVVRP